MSSHTLVVVSNRLPISVRRVDGELVFESSSGGLATAMSSLADEDRVWVGWPGIPAETLTAAEKSHIAKEFAKHGYYPVHLTTEQVELFYEGYANDTLWPLFHYFQAHAKHKREYWRAYQVVNQRFADAVARVARSDATVWVHDYHLLLLPAMLRKKMPQLSIGFFLHVPFPSFEIFRLLPERDEILRGLLGADLLGFHVYDYARHFLSSCLRLLGMQNHHGSLEYAGRRVKVDAYPIGIDFKKFTESIRQPDAQEALEALNEAYEDQKVIISIDRLDYSKGIEQRLEGFSSFLENNPKYLGNVRLVMVAVPSRTEVETYQDLRDHIELMVSRINGTFGTTEWAPISYQFQNLPFAEILALYNRADVALVTPLRDGMNLVAKEFVAAKCKQPGVLILSEMAGAIDELPEALSINPNDAKSIEKALVKALSMSKLEQRKRLEAMQKRIAEYTVSEWSADFLSDLHEIREESASTQRKLLTIDQIDTIRKRFTLAKKPLVVLDYDGTLQTFKSSPSTTLARPSADLMRLLKTLRKHANLAIVSGRKQSSLDTWFRGTDFILVAEHGAWVKTDGAWKNTAGSFESAKALALPLFQKYSSRTPGSLIEEKDYALVWHYRMVPPDLAYVRLSNLKHELESELNEDEVGIHSGNKILEIKPKHVHKGRVLRDLIRELAPDFVLAAGDDYTDEDMFEELPRDGVGIKVGFGETKARYQVASVEQMIALLRSLC